MRYSSSRERLEEAGLPISGRSLLVADWASDCVGADTASRSDRLASNRRFSAFRIATFRPGLGRVVSPGYRV
jgi:hypothetical protein